MTSPGLTLNKYRGICLSLLALAACPKDQPGASESGTGDTAASDTTAEPTPTEAGETAGSSVCQEACEHLTACGNQLLAPSMAGCISLCEASDLIDTEWCKSAALDWYACLTDAPCEEIMPGPSGVCAVPFADYSVSCVPCSASIEPDTADRCFATAECSGGFAVSFGCEGDTCTCQLDGEIFATCPAASACASDDAAIQAAAEQCCKMPFTPFVAPGD